MTTARTSPPRRSAAWAAAGLSLGLLPGCSSEAVDAAEPTPRAVSAVEQRVTNPARKLRIAGTADAWKQETLSFQVGGRIVWVTEPEKSVDGPTIDENFLPGRDGTLIARIDPERYQNALDSANANLKATEARARATRQEVEDVIPQDIAQAETEERRARDNRDRLKRAVERNAAAGTDLTNAEAALETAKAGIEAVRGRLKAKQSELEGLEAQALQARQQVRSAELDLRDTELRAPFAGRITGVNVVPGALVQPGTPIADLVMMDPIKIDITVSTETARAVGDQDEGLIFPEGVDGPVVANLYQRDSITDSATRTTRLTFICRNPESDSLRDGVTVLPDIIPLIQFPKDVSQAWFIERRCIHRDEQGTFAWKVKARNLRQITGEVIELERIPIQLGDARKDFVGLYQFQEVIPTPEIQSMLSDVRGITVRKLLFGLGLPEGFEGGKAMVVRPDWDIRPGDVVDVQLDLESAPPGVYVPASAVCHDNDQAFVLRVVPQGSGFALERTDIDVSGSVGDRVRIADAPLGAGEPIVKSGTHVLTEGMRVELTATEAAR